MVKLAEVKWCLRELGKIPPCEPKRKIWIHIKKLNLIPLMPLGGIPAEGRANYVSQLLRGEHVLHVYQPSNGHWRAPQEDRFQSSRLISKQLEL